MRKFSLFLMAFLLAATMAFAAAGRQATDSGPVPIGAVFPLSGGVSLYGTESRDGAILAIEEINASGGLLGRQLRLIAEDDENDPTKAINAVTKLTTVDRVSFIIGSSTSGATMAMTQLAQQQRIVLMTPSGTNLAVTTPGDYIFRACFIDPFQGVVAGNFAYGTLNARRAAVLYDAGADYNTGLANEFKQQFLRNGGQIVADEAYQTGDVDFNAQATRIRAANPDIVYLPNYYNDVGLQIRQLRAQGITVPFLRGDGWKGVSDNTGNEFLNTFWTSLFATDTTDPKGAAFVRAFQARFGRPATSFGALGYDSMMLIADAIKAANSFDSAQVKNALARINGPYVTGNIRYDANRNPIKSIDILEIVNRNGSLTNVYRTTVNP
jgi:branched-chain amino acid transport system substrate-binding protein